MENFPASSYEPDNGEQSTASLNTVTYPPKYQKQPQRVNVWLRSLGSLALYLVLGYYIFHSFELLLLITLIVVFHELGHFFAMKYFGYSDLGIFFIPLLGAYASGTKREVSQKESAIILLAGPLPGIIVGIIFFFLYKNNPELEVAGIPFDRIALFFIFLNLINLIPVYPLDGGQLLNRIFLDEESWISKGFIFLSILFLCWLALFGMDRPFYPLLIFPAMMLLRFRGDSQFNSTEKEIEAQGINADISYEELSDEDYWKIRNILIQKHASFKDIPPAPPYEYSPKEEKIMSTIQGLLHRNLIEDVSIAGKLLIFLIWGAGLAAPWLLNVDMSFFHRFGF